MPVCAASSSNPSASLSLQLLLPDEAADSGRWCRRPPTPPLPRDESQRRKREGRGIRSGYYSASQSAGEKRGAASGEQTPGDIFAFPLVPSRADARARTSESALLVYLFQPLGLLGICTYLFQPLKLCTYAHFPSHLSSRKNSKGYSIVPRLVLRGIISSGLFRALLTHLGSRESGVLVPGMFSYKSSLGR